MENIDFLLKQQAEKQSLIQRADTKASAILVVLGILFSAFINIFLKISVNWQRYVFVSIFCLCFIFLLFVLIMLIIFPRQKKSGILYLAKAKNISFEDYKKSIKLLNDDKIIDSLIEQNYILEMILSKKNFYLKIAFISLFCTSLVLIFGIICAMI